MSRKGIFGALVSYAGVLVGALLVSFVGGSSTIFEYTTLGMLIVILAEIRDDSRAAD